jgi:hypothetical protein
MHDDEIDIERAGREPDYRRQVLARLNRESAKPAKADQAPTPPVEITVE